MKRGRDSDVPQTEQIDKKAIAAAIDAALKDPFRTPDLFPESLVISIVRAAAREIMSEPMLVQIDAPLCICGDIHGQLHDLAAIMKSQGTPPGTRYLFLGDYVDRGKHGVECICILLGLKVLYPSEMFILRGNHESAGLTKQYGFFDECKRRYSVKIWKLFIDLFNWLPVAALVEDAALCMHGGISPDLKSLDNIAAIQRPCDAGDKGLLCDLLWSDPEPGVGKWQANERGVSYVFGEEALRDTLKSLDLDLIVRAHQVMDQGYQFFAGRSLVTVFSASNYCGEFTNCGAVMKMDKELRCSFQIFKPRLGKM
jgi:diadenosine tetraphosphatase ApaH/serine/threonine PP2A family protein phosphatase